MKLSVAIAGADALPSAFVVFRGIDTSIKKAAQLGYDGVELALKSSDEVEKNHLQAVLRENGLSISAVSTGQVWSARKLSFTDEDSQKREELKKAFCGFIDLASDFGQKVNMGRIRGGFNGREQGFCEDLFIDMAGYLAHYAEKRGVTLLLEPVNRYEIDFINNTDECAALIKKAGCTNLKMMPDVFHMNIEDAHIGEALRRNKDYVDYVHFADTNRYAPGQGHMNWDEIFAALQDIKYDGWTSVEIFPVPDPDTAAKQAISFIKEKYGKYYK
ncbi:sugar phosphate isomerase/epimerase [Treponema sp. OMZ 840]|uniref:TIM barrel protein n=1 Tax=Treponema sp. OMZ 840 TaxID=244313 RepID=UPI003D905E3D